MEENCKKNQNKNYSGWYVCECGKEFTNSQSFNAHKSHCKIHFESKGTPEMFEKRNSQASKALEKAQIINKENGLNVGWDSERLSHIYYMMKERCYNPNKKDYRFYGAKGIKICKEWLDNPLEFSKWAVENGYEENLSIDRIDSSKDYCPENCRWIPMEENSRFKSTTNYITVNGILKSGTQWALYLGHSKNYINDMIRNKGIDFAIKFISDHITE